MYATVSYIRIVYLLLQSLTKPVHGMAVMGQKNDCDIIFGPSHYFFGGVI